MPLPFALPLGLLLGGALAWLARGELARSEVPLVLTRPFLVTLGFAAFVFAPVVGYFVALHGDWAYLYLVRWSRVPSAVDLVLVLLAAAHVPLGFAGATPWALAKRGSRIFQVALALALVIATAAVLMANRLSVSASYTQVRGGFGGVPLGQTALGRGILLALGALAIGYAWTVHAIRSAPRR